MTIDPDALAALAGEYSRSMTRTRGRRVQRLVGREFAGADDVRLLALAAGGRAVVGRSMAGAALCATDGRGPHAAVFKWAHGSAEALEIRFDLLKDSLPVLVTQTVDFAGLLADFGLRLVSRGALPVLEAAPARRPALMPRRSREGR